MHNKKLTPAQIYMINAYKALQALQACDNGNINPALLDAIIKRPKTLASAINAAFYRSTGQNLSTYID